MVQAEGALVLTLRSRRGAHWYSSLTLYPVEQAGGALVLQLASGRVQADAPTQYLLLRARAAVSGAGAGLTHRLTPARHGRWVVRVRAGARAYARPRRGPTQCDARFPPRRSCAATVSPRDGTSPVKDASCARSGLLSNEDCSCDEAATRLPTSRATRLVSEGAV